jgi:hypothetical protein
LTQDHIDKCFALIDRGIWVDGKATGEYFTFNQNQKEGDRISRWVGTVVRSALGCTPAQAKDFVGKWREANFLVGIEYKSPTTRKLTKGCCTPKKANSMGAEKKEEETQESLI